MGHKINGVALLEGWGSLNKTRRSKIVSRASAMSVEHLLCAMVPKITFVIVLKDACLKEKSCNCNHTEIGVSLFTVKSFFLLKMKLRTDI